MKYESEAHSLLFCYGDLGNLPNVSDIWNMQNTREFR